MVRCCLVLFAALGLTGCWNAENISLRLGDVSLGQQLIDFQRARDAGALDEGEYRRVRTALISVTMLCGERME